MRVGCRQLDLTQLARLAAERRTASRCSRRCGCSSSAFAEQPRLGESRKAADDPVRLGQAPHLHFAPSDVAAFESDRGRPARASSSTRFGVFGPNGALPLHLTEHAYERRRHKEDGTIADFLNLFQHRLISLFYRAWAELGARREPRSARRATASALTSARCFGLAPESARGRDAVLGLREARRAPACLRSRRARPTACEAILADYFGSAGRDAAVRAARGSTSRAICSAGWVTRRAGVLGSSCTLGGSSWQCQHKFEIVLGPLALDDFTQLSARGARPRRAARARAAYTNDEWTWQLRLLLQDVEIPGIAPRRAVASSAGRAGWARAGRRADVVIQETAAARGPAHHATSRASRMGDISRVALFGKLNSLAYKSIESATVFCKLRGNPYVELVHWIHQILQQPNSDLHVHRARLRARRRHASRRTSRKRSTACRAARPRSPTCPRTSRMRPSAPGCGRL